MIKTSKLSNFLTSIPLIESCIDQVISSGQETSLFELRRIKNNRFKKRASLKKKHTKWLTYLGPLLINLENEIFPIEVLPNRFIQDLSQNIEHYKKTFKNAIIILQNNDFSGASEDSLSAYAELFETCEDTVFAIWDTDNHHWVKLSIFLASHSDYYFPAHPVFHDIYSRYTDHLLPNIYSGSLQWKRSFLLERYDHIVTNQRRMALFGKHGFYQKFGARNTTLVSVNREFEDVTFITEQYAAKTEAKRFEEWTNHLYHFIAPVNNDLPYRLFDAIVTGGVPVVPEYYRQFFEKYSISVRPIYYNVDHLYEPQTLKEMVSVRAKQDYPLRHLTATLYVELVNRFHANHGLNQILCHIHETELMPDYRWSS